MQAKLELKEDITIVHLSGRIDYEAADKFRETCLKVLVDKKLVFDLASLSFVGSSGITPFLETMQDLYYKNRGYLKLSRVGVEFRKIFESSKIKDVEIYEDVDTARIAFAKPVCSFVEKPSDVLSEVYMPKEYDIKD